MTINNFYLNGFTCMDKGEEGAIFIRYAQENADTRKPEIRETPLYYGGAETVNFVLSVPKPRPPKITACAIVTRTSKNCYSATVYDEQRIRTFKAESLTCLQNKCKLFFETTSKSLK